MTKKKRIILIAVITIIVLAAVVVSIILLAEPKPETKYPVLYPGSYEETKEILLGAKQTFLVPDANILSDYSFGFHTIFLDEPEGEPVGYTITGNRNPSSDHYEKTVKIKCTLVDNQDLSAEGEQFEQYQNVKIYSDAEGTLYFCFEGCKYTVDCDLKSHLGGIQGPEVDREEALKLVKLLIDAGKDT